MSAIDFSRRDSLKILGLAGAAVALGGRVARADTVSPAAPTAVTQGSGFYRTHVGEFEITIVSDGQFPLTPYPTIGSNASQEAVEAVLKDNFIDPANLIGQVNMVTIRKGAGPVTVIDTGCGKLFGPAAGFGKQNLVASGVSPDDVETVIFTHMHPDHVGGALGDDGKPYFTKATHWVSQVEHDFWTGAAPDLSKSGLPDAMKPTMIGAAKNAAEKLGDKLKTFPVAALDNAKPPLFDWPAYTISPGITLFQTGGHTPGHCVLLIESNGESIAYVTDLVVQAQLVLAHPEWLVGFDTDMQGTVKIRQQLFAALADHRTLITGSHLPFPSLGHVKKAGEGYSFVPALWRWS